MKQNDSRTTIVCPYCGKTITIMILGQKTGLLNAQSGGPGPGPAMLRPLGNRRMHPYQYGTQSLYDPASAGMPATTTARVPIREFSQEPVRAAGWEPDVVVPISNALIAGLLATTILGTCCFFIEGLPLWLPPVGGLGTTTIVWWMLQKYGLDMQRRIQEVEYDEQPQPQDRIVNTHDTLYVIPAPAGSQVEQHNDGSYWVKNPDKPNGWTRIGEAAIPYKSALPRVARAILPPPEGMSCPFTKRRLAQATGLSEEQVLNLQRALMNAGLLQWRDDNPNHPAGPELTETGKELFTRVLDAPYAGAPE